MAEQEVNGIGLNVDSGLFEVGATLPQTGSWSIGCDVTVEDVDASVQEVRVNDISLSGSLAIPEVSVDIDANNDKVMDLEIGIAASGLSTGITERQIVPYDKIVKITEFSPESINERKYASSALAAKRIYDLIKEGGAGLNEDELKAFLKRYGYVTEEYVNELLKDVSSFFYLSEDGQSIGTPYNIFSEKEISANGLSVGSGGSGSGEGGGLIRTVLTSSSLGSVTSNDNFTTFNAFAIDSIYKKVKSIEEGNVSLSNYYTKSESDARFALLSSLTTVEEKIREILSWFTIDESGNLRTELNLYSTKEISAGGFNGTGGSTGGGLISTVLGIDKFGTVTTNSNTSTFNAYAIDSLHKRIKNLEESEVDLTGYATEEWVMGRGFITSAALTPYLKTADFETWKTSSFNPVVSQVNTNKNNIAEILKWFAIDGDGNLYTTYNFYSTKEISSGGFDSGSNGTGGLIGVVYGKSSFGTIANEANNATFNAYAIDSLYKRIVSLENKEVDLTGYATESWVAGQGFITSAALSPYMKTADANDTFATKTAINNLGKRVTANEGNIAEILKWFAVDSDGNLYTTYNLYSTKEISANGLSVGTGGGGGGLISQVFGTTAFGTIAAESNSATFNAYAIDSLYKRIVSLEGKATAVSFVPALTSGKMIGTLSIDGVSTVLYGVDAYSKADADGRYLKLTGGEINGYLSVSHATQSIALGVNSKSTDYVAIRFTGANGNSAYLVYSGNGDEWAVTPPNWAGSRILLHSNNYSNYALPLSGGTISGSGSGILTINRTSGTPLISFQANGTNVGFLGIDTVSRPCFVDPVYYETSYLIHSGNYNSYAPKLDGTGASGTWGISISGNARTLKTTVYPVINANEVSYTDGALRFMSGVGDTSTNLPVFTGWQNALIAIPLHDNGATAQMYFSKGYGEFYYRSHQSYAWRTVAFTDSNVASADVIATAYANQSIDLGREGKVRMIYGTASNATSLGYPRQFTSGLSVLTGYTGWQMVTYGGTSIPNPYFRSLLDNGTFSDWKQLAFLTDNVASATKLATARTIWGQSFDGSGNVSGNIQGGKANFTIYGYNSTLASNVNILTHDNNKSLWLGYGMNAEGNATIIAGTSIEFRYGTSRGIAAFINSSGNVTIGSSDLAGTTYKLYANGASKLNGNVYVLGNILGKGTNGGVYYYHGIRTGESLSIETVDANADWKTQSITILTNGNVGIGTTSPAYKLDVNGSIRAYATDTSVRHLYAENSAGKVSLYVAASGNRGILDATNSKWVIVTNGTNTWLDTGNVGIGTSAPEHKLHINGNAAAIATDGTPRSFRAINSNGTISLLSSTSRGVYDSTNSRWLIGTNGTNSFLNCGNVGIGTDGPAYRLDVNGTARFAQAVTMSSTLHVVDVSTFESYLNIQAGIRPNADNARYVGTSSYRFNEGYINNVYTNAVYVGKGTTYGFKSDGSINATLINATNDIITSARLYAPYLFLGRNAEGIYLTSNGVSWHNSSNNYQSGLFGFRYNEIIAYQSITANSGVKVASGQAITFLDASGKEHKLTYDSTAGAFKFDGNILVTGDGQFNAIN